MIDDPFQYLTFGGTFGRTFLLFFDRFDLYMAISAVVMVPFVLFFVSAIVLLVWSFFSMEDPEELAGLVGFLVFGIEFLVYALATVIGKGAVTYAVAKVYTGEHPEWRECLKKAWSRKWHLLGASLLVDGTIFLGLMLIAGFLFFFIFFPNGFTITLLVVASLVFSLGVAYAYSGVMLVTPSTMVESFSPIKAVKRSWELSTGSRCYLVCTMMSLYCCLLVVTAFLVNLFGSRNMVSPLDLVIRIVPLSLYFPLHSIIQTVLYLNLRVGRESMNHTVISGDLMTNSASLPSRFGNRDPSPDSIDYRHVPLMDEGDDGNP
uniref:Glycerophosphoryl diester phosphodiesterase membrane domain-containing protein n=1 Tax=Pseudo-nitzschia delicatissima TaxID=44447 RepID=A0A7S0UI75_9STRA|mmetsp:Transcript_870/g.1773  ORF Transcript_870/g.1773 Transcript_870/m.1773 type:complete len:319 (+) Transcript_870:184-1140(+)